MSKITLEEETVADESPIDDGVDLINPNLSCYGVGDTGNIGSRSKLEPFDDLSIYPVIIKDELLSNDGTNPDNPNHLQNPDFTMSDDNEKWKHVSEIKDDEVPLHFTGTIEEIKQRFGEHRVLFGGVLQKDESKIQEEPNEKGVYKNGTIYTDEKLAKIEALPKIQVDLDLSISKESVYLGDIPEPKKYIQFEDFEKLSGKQHKNEVEKLILHMIWLLRGHPKFCLESNQKILEMVREGALGI